MKSKIILNKSVKVLCIYIYFLYSNYDFLSCGVISTTTKILRLIKKKKK